MFVHSFAPSFVRSIEQAIWRGHAGPISVAQWNPKEMMFASACTNLAFWLPNEQIVQEQEQLQQAQGLIAQ